MLDSTNLIRQARDLAQQGFRLLLKAPSLPPASQVSRKVIDYTPPARALEWIRVNESPNGGIRVHSGHPDAYPEVSGYIIPTLLQYGEKVLATRLIRWLICIQRSDGSYTSPEGVPHVFDTGQVLRGLLAGAKLVPGSIAAARRSADYLCQQMVEGGKGGFGVRYSGSIPESVHLYILPPLLQAAEVLEKSEYKVAAECCLEYYCEHEGALQIDELTHFLGYELEALIDLDRTDVAIKVLDTLHEQQVNGSVRGKSDEKWVCSPGLAQLAICWYKIGQWEPADKALAWLEEHQQPSGGFFGSYGPGASYFPDDELSWAVKFYLDAHLLRVMSFFDRNAHIFPSAVSKDDGRAQAILSIVNPNDRVLEIGCGKGCFLQVVNEVYPATKCTGVVFTPALLAHVPEDIRTILGSLESIPSPDDSFDVVFSVEAIEHSANPAAVVAEMIRVARPGGWVIIIDKQQSHWGRMDCPPWERWPEIKTLSELLNKGCDNVTAEPVGYDGKLSADGMMAVWHGQKRSRLTGSQWNEVLISPASQQTVVKRVQHNHISEWGQVILLATSPGERVLEIGSGTGEISLHLAQAGCEVTALDSSAKSLEFIQRCAADLGVTVEIFQADATQPLLFADDEFNCTWSSGLLEHFNTEERRDMLREWRRITRGEVITLVPNASCVAYRAGKAYQEERGTWPYGLEIPILSLRDDFEAVGLQIVSEYSVGVNHALSFLPVDHPLRKSLANWIRGMPIKELQECNQGYLLVTIGSS